MKPSDPRQSSTKPDIDALVENELAAIKTDANGRLLLRIADLELLSVETQLILLFHYACGTASISDEEVVKHLKSTHYMNIHPTKGGLEWKAYNEYARACSRLDKAAKQHRAHIGSIIQK